MTRLVTWGKGSLAVARCVTIKCKSQQLLRKKSHLTGRSFLVCFALCFNSSRSCFMGSELNVVTAGVI